MPLVRLFGALDALARLCLFIILIIFDHNVVKLAATKRAEVKIGGGNLAAVFAFDLACEREKLGAKILYLFARGCDIGHEKINRFFVHLWCDFWPIRFALLRLRARVGRLLRRR